MEMHAIKAAANIQPRLDLLLDFLQG